MEGTKVKEIINHFFQDLRITSPFILIFYLIFLLVALFFQSIRVYVNWPLFYLSALFFLFFSLKSKTVIFFLETIKKLINILYKYFNKKYKIWTLFDWFIVLSGILLLACSLYCKIGVFNFLVLFYGIVSFCLILDSRIAAGLALFLLICCLFLLIFKNNILAEKFAVFSYYFLVITACTGIRECRKKCLKNDKKRYTQQKNA